MRKPREVVSKDAVKTRQTKSESYDLTDAYEVGLLNYAEDPEHGNYSEFVKRAIAYYRDSRQMRPVGVVAVTVPMENDDDDSVEGFL